MLVLVQVVNSPNTTSWSIYLADMSIGSIDKTVNPTVIAMLMWRGCWKNDTTTMKSTIKHHGWNEAAYRALNPGQISLIADKTTFTTRGQHSWKPSTRLDRCSGKPSRRWKHEKKKLERSQAWKDDKKSLESQLNISKAQRNKPETKPKNLTAHEVVEIQNSFGRGNPYMAEIRKSDNWINNKLYLTDKICSTRTRAERRIGC